jgi:hypothetical protein
MGPAETAEIVRLVRAGHACILVCCDDELEGARAARDAAAQLHMGAMQWSATVGLCSGQISTSDGQPVDAVGGTENPGAALHHLTRRGYMGMVIAFDLLAHLSGPGADARALRAWRELVDSFRAQAQNGLVSGVLVMIDHEPVAPPVVAAGSVRVEVKPPDAARVESLVRETVKSLDDRMGITAKLSPQALDTLRRSLRGLSARQVRAVLHEVITPDRRLSDEDLPGVLSAKKRLLFSQGGALELVEAPTSMDQIGGLSRLKAWLHQRREALSAEAQAFGVSPPRGLLLVGVQGAGKSLSAKAIATAWERPLLRLDAGSLYDRFVGESEKRLRAALDQAEAMAPVVLWIDEIEKAFASAAEQSTDGGLSRRMFGALLTWMNDHTSPVFLVATANDIAALPPELLRKGRFDEIFFIDLPGPRARAQIASIQLRRRGRDPGAFDLGAIAQASEGRSGSEIEVAVGAAVMGAFAERRQPTTDDVVRALRDSPPLSVTMAERISALRAWGRARCVPADDEAEGSGA